MKKNKTWLVIIVHQDGKYHAFTQSAFGSDNLFSQLNMWNGIQSANICASKKDAEQLAEFWNECYRNNGTWLYSHEEATE